MIDPEAVKLIKDIRISIQDAHSIMKVLERLACIGDDCSKEAKDLYWAILYDCAKNIKLRLDEYSCGFVYCPEKSASAGGGKVEGHAIMSFVKTTRFWA